MKFLKKNSKLVAFAAVALAILAAPYLTSIDPDSRVFRSAILPVLLFLAAYFPVANAYEKLEERALRYGLVYGLVFVFFLGIGSELTVYGEFLPGKGSLIRRLAVPLMATPFLGALFSYCLSFVPGREWLVRIGASSGQKGRNTGLEAQKKLEMKWLPCFLLIAAVYTVFLLAYYPGIVNYDFFTELIQYQTGPFFGAHPVFHTLLTGFLFTTGYSISGGYTLGAILYCAVQIIVMAAAYASVVTFVSKRVPRWASVLTLLFFAFFPVHGFMAISTVKDAMFAAMLALLVIQVWAVQEDSEAFLSSVPAMVRFALTCMLLSMLRHNGVFAYAFAFIAVILLCRKWKAVILCVAALVLSLGVPQILKTAVSAWDTPSSEMMSVPCQQIMRTAVKGDMSEEERESIGEWFSGALERYRPYSADPAKGGNFDYQRYKADPSEYWKLWADLGKRYPKIYLEAFLLNCAGLWNPDDVSHAHALDTEGWDFVYTKTEIIFPPEVGTLEQHSLIPKLQKFLQGIAHSSRHERIPVVALLFRPSFYVYLLFMTAFLCRVRRTPRQRMVLLPIWGIVLSYVFSACILVRYAYSFMATVPVAALLIFLSAPENAGKGKNG